MESARKKIESVQAATATRVTRVVEQSDKEDKLPGGVWSAFFVEERGEIYPAPKEMKLIKIGTASFPFSVGIQRQTGGAM